LRFVEPDRFMSSRRQTVIYAIAAVIAVAGLAEATYLTLLNLLGETAVCGASQGCAQVLGSKYAKIGPVPLAGLGAAAYFVTFTLATFAACGYSGARRFFAASVLAMFAATLCLLYLQAFVLHAFCRYCLVSAALIFFLTGIALLAPIASDSSGR
jgi:uncharacterized membrane protein